MLGETDNSGLKKGWMAEGEGQDQSSLERRCLRGRKVLATRLSWGRVREGARALHWQAWPDEVVVWLWLDNPVRSSPASRCMYCSGYCAVPCFAATLAPIPLTASSSPLVSGPGRIRMVRGSGQATEWQQQQQLLLRISCSEDVFPVSILSVSSECG